MSFAMTALSPRVPNAERRREQSRRQEVLAEQLKTLPDTSGSTTDAPTCTPACHTVLFKQRREIRQIECDNCKKWFCYFCVGLDKKPSDWNPKIWHCPLCEHKEEERRATEQLSTLHTISAIESEDSDGNMDGDMAIDEELHTSDIIDKVIRRTAVTSGLSRFHSSCDRIIEMTTRDGSAYANGVDDDISDPDTFNAVDDAKELRHVQGKDSDTEDDDSDDDDVDEDDGDADADDGDGDDDSLIEDWQVIHYQQDRNDTINTLAFDNETGELIQIDSDNHPKPAVQSSSSANTSRSSVQPKGGIINRGEENIGNNKKGALNSSSTSRTKRDSTSQPKTNPAALAAKKSKTGGSRLSTIEVITSSDSATATSSRASISSLGLHDSGNRRVRSSTISSSSSLSKGDGDAGYKYHGLNEAEQNWNCLRCGKSNYFSAHCSRCMAKRN